MLNIYKCHVKEVIIPTYSLCLIELNLWLFEASSAFMSCLGAVTDRARLYGCAGLPGPILLVINIIYFHTGYNIWAPSSEFVSSSIPSWQILTVHAPPFKEARDLAFCLKVPLDSLLVWASSWGSGETARMRRLAWTFAARICDKYQIHLTRSI